MFHRPPTSCFVAAVLLGALWLGCEERRVLPSPSTSASASVDARPLELDVVAVRDCEAAPHAPLESDEMLLGVKIKVRALRDQTPQNYFYASIVDSERRRYPPTFIGCAPRLVGEPLAAGAIATGFVNFILPREARGLSIEYAPRIGNTNKARGTLVARDLGR
jgi:hypothetical protein